MKLNPFKKNKDNLKTRGKAPDVISEPQSVEPSKSPAPAIPITGRSVLEGFFVSEKASSQAAMGQYVFRVATKANKSEIKKAVAKTFQVKVRNVKIIKLPAKHRAVGRYVGAKPGFKKAIVVLEPGQVISQATV